MCVGGMICLWMGPHGSNMTPQRYESIVYERNGALCAHMSLTLMGPLCVLPGNVASGGHYKAA